MDKRTKLVKDITHIMDGTVSDWLRSINELSAEERWEELREMSCDAGRALEQWLGAVRFIADERYIDALSELLVAYELARKWGDCSDEWHAMAIVRKVIKEGEE